MTWLLLRHSQHVSDEFCLPFLSSVVLGGQAEFMCLLICVILGFVSLHLLILDCEFTVARVKVSPQKGFLHIFISSDPKPV